MSVGSSVTMHAKYVRVGAQGPAVPTTACNYCADSAQIGTVMPQWLQHLLCARCIRRKRRGCGTSDKHKYWMNFDACGVICATFVHAASWFAGYTVVTELLMPWYGLSFWGVFHGALFNFVVLMSCLCHMRAMLSNPGAVPSDSKPTEPSGWAKTCYKCNNHKPARAHHCSICERCIIKMDHHCPWVNNCVGLANHKYFLLFLMYVFLMGSYAVGLLSTRAWQCMGVPGAAGESQIQGKCLGSPGGLALLASVFVLGILFGLFVLCMMIDQSATIVSGETKIDRMKSHHGHSHGGHGGHSHGGGGGHGAGAEEDEGDDSDPQAARKRYWDGLGEIFGGDPWHEGVRWHWFVPTAIQYKNPEVLTGYCFRDTPRPKTLAEMEEV